MFGSSSSDLQEEILRLWDRNPDMGVKAIASQADCSESYVRETLREYRPTEYETAKGSSGGGDLLDF